MQFDPIKPTFKAPGTKRLTPKHDEPLSSVAFKFNLRRYTEVAEEEEGPSDDGEDRVGRCRSTLSNRS